MGDFQTTHLAPTWDSWILRTLWLVQRNALKRVHGSGGTRFPILVTTILSIGWNMMNRTDSTNLEKIFFGERRRRREGQRRPKLRQEAAIAFPQQGQLQIVIKNPNKTAVKLFLVPYDLSDMEAGQKTFIRQRSYSAGPIIDMPLSTRNNLGTDRPEAALSHSDDPNDRPILRYLIHLHICCPSKGRYYLYKSIRVVFANRVPDGKEKLRTFIYCSPALG
ncbi:hypothetical protein N0V90_011520 [Kalmusia sp. IMI 367209]|nr:hypothetical protein N0V90_011520 [Kalmusia sp. IMI 367209]